MVDRPGRRRSVVVQAGAGHRLGQDEFLCAQEYPDEKKPQPTVFELTNGGLTPREDERQYLLGSKATPMPVPTLLLPDSRPLCAMAVGQRVRDVWLLALKPRIKLANVVERTNRGEDRRDGIDCNARAGRDLRPQRGILIDEDKRAGRYVERMAEDGVVVMALECRLGIRFPQ